MNLQQILRNMASNYVRMVFNILSTLLLTPLIVQKLGSEALGIWALTNTVAGYFNLTDLGITSAAIKYISHYRATEQWDELNKTIETSQTCFAIMACVSLLLGVVLSQTAPLFFHIDAKLLTETKLLMLITGVVACIGFATVIPIQCAIAAQRQDVLNKWLLVVQIFSSIASLCAVYAGWGIVSLGLLQVFSAASTGLVGYIVSRVYLPQAKFRIFWHHDHGKIIASFASFALLASLASRIIYFTDTIVIGHFMSIIAVAGYSVALKILEFMRSLVGCGAGVLGTFVSDVSAKNKPEEHFAFIWLEGTKWSLVFCLTISCLCIFQGADLIRSWAGIYNPQAGLALAILSVGLTLDLSQSAACQILNNGGKQKELSLLFCMEAIGNLTLSLLLIKSLGLLGVAIGTIIPQCIRVLVFWFVLMPKVTMTSPTSLLQQGVAPAIKASAGSMLLISIFHALYPRASLPLYVVLGIICAAALSVGVLHFCFTEAQRNKITARVKNKLTAKSVSELEEPNVAPDSGEISEPELALAASRQT